MYSESDLVKLREVNPTLSQSAARGERSMESYGGVSQEVVRAISAPGDSNIDDSTSGDNALTKEGRDWARTSRLRLPGANSRAITAGQRIYTDADLVKPRDADPGQGPGIGLEAVRAILAPFQEAAETKG